MRRLRVAILAVLLLTLTGGSASADPLSLIRGAALIPYFDNTLPAVSLLVIASPVSDVGPDEHLFYYSTSCVRVDSSFVPLTQNDTNLFIIRDGVISTTAPEGAVLITGTTNGADQVPILDPFVARLLWYDNTTDHGRVIDAAGGIEFGTNSEGAWGPLDTGAVFPFMPPDDGATFFDRVIFTCPIGTVPSSAQTGAPNLAADMNALVPYSPLTSSVGLFAVIYDEEEEPINDWTAECQCVGIRPGSATSFITVARLSQLNPAYTTASTYTEIQAANEARFMLHWGIDVHVGAANLEWWGRGHFGEAALISGGGPQALR
jgi:hypothetical protein